MEKYLEKLNQFYIYANEGLYIDKIKKNNFYTMTCILLYSSSKK